jgi:hypothetical protein
VIEDGLGEEWPRPVVDAVAPFLQGQLIEKPPLFYAADLRHAIWQTTRLVAETVEEDGVGEEFIDVAANDRPPYGIITTQSCDLAEERPDPRQPWFSVAPVYLVDPVSPLKDREYVYALAPPAVAGHLWVADLRIELPLEKSLLVGRVPIDAFPDEQGAIGFANFLARRRGRPALASVFHDVVSTTTRQLKDASHAQRNLARRARANVYQLRLAVQEGTRLQPVAARLYVVTDGDPSDDARAWFDLWWNEARLVAQAHNLQLHPVGWLDAGALDARLYDDLIEYRNPL